MEYRNPIYLKDGRIDCEIRHSQYGWIAFTCDPNDRGASFDTAALFAQMQPHAAPYVPPTQEELDAQAANAVRAERDFKLLSEVDPIAGNALRWASLTIEQQQAWANYRQALLDIPQQAGFPYNVEWPTKPN